MEKKEFSILIKTIKKLLKEVHRYQHGTINLSSSASIEGYSNSERQKLYVKSQNQDTTSADQKRVTCETIICDILETIMSYGHSKAEIVKCFSFPDSEYVRIFCDNIELKEKNKKLK